MNKNPYLTTGEFAKIADTTKNTLFHYDRIGLFSPEQVLDNDYRLYSVYQLEVFNTIRMLKDMGMSLEDIKTFLQHRNADIAKQKLQEMQVSIQEELQRLQAKYNLVSRYIADITRSQQVSLRECSLKQYPQRYYTGAKLSGMMTLDKGYYIGACWLIREFKQNNPDRNWKLAFVQKPENLFAGMYDAYEEMILLTDTVPEGESSSVLPAGTYLVAYHRGEWTTLGEAYQRMTAYIRAHDLRVLSDFYEYDILDGVAVNDYDQYVTEIVVRVEEA